MMPRKRRLAVMHAARPLCVWAAITGGASALAGGVMIAAMQAGAPFAAFAASALALLAMALIPGTLARCYPLAVIHEIKTKQDWTPLLEVKSVYLKIVEPDPVLLARSDD